MLSLVQKCFLLVFQVLLVRAHIQHVTLPCSIHSELWPINVEDIPPKHKIKIFKKKIIKTKNPDLTFNSSCNVPRLFIWENLILFSKIGIYCKFWWIYCKFQWIYFQFCILKHLLKRIFILNKVRNYLFYFQRDNILLPENCSVCGWIQLWR